MINETDADEVVFPAGYTNELIEPSALVEYKKLFRIKRNTLLAETDWWAVSDRTMTQAETDYRQALRDVPEQEGFPVNITWPTKP